VAILDGEKSLRMRLLSHLLSFFAYNCAAFSKGEESCVWCVCTRFDTYNYENLYSPHNSDSSSDKIDTKLYNKDTKNKLN